MRCIKIKENCYLVEVTKTPLTPQFVRSIPNKLQKDIEKILKSRLHKYEIENTQIFDWLKTLPKKDLAQQFSEYLFPNFSSEQYFYIDSKKKRPYMLSSIPVGYVIPELTHTMLTDGKNYEPLVKALYALAYKFLPVNPELVQQILEVLKDTIVLDEFEHIKTEDQKQKFADRLLCSMRGPKHRLGNNVAPYFSVLELLELFQKDQESKIFLPQDYKRIGCKEIIKEDYAQFNPSSTLVPIQQLVWNESRLNLSIRVQIPGTVTLSEECSSLGLSDIYPTFIWRNYTVVKDGKLNILWLSMQLSKHSFEVCQEQFLIPHYIVWDPKEIYTLPLGILPLVKSLKEENVFEDLAKKSVEALEYKALLKVLNHFWLRYLPYKATKRDSSFKRAQELFLKKAGFQIDGAYNPPRTTEPPSQMYEVDLFEIKIKSFSSLPKMEDLLAKINTLPNTPSVTLMREHISDVLKEIVPLERLGYSVVLAWIEEYIQTITKNLQALKYDIYSAKFRLLAESPWISYENSVTVDEKTVVFSTRKVSVPVTD